MIVMDWDTMAYELKELAQKVHRGTHTPTGKLKKPIKGIVALSRGGLIPGVVLSHKMGLPLKVIQFSSKNGKGNKDNTNEIPDWFKLDRYIVVDDICDSGYTFKELYDENMDNIFCSLILRKESVFEPDYYVSLAVTDEWFEFPWENV